MTEFDEQQSGGISRRTVTKAMAWAVPAIAIASPVPAFAGASQGTIEFTGQNCKLPGSSSVYTNGAVYIMTVSNTTAQDSQIEITSVTRGGVDHPGTETTVVKLSGGVGCCVSLSNVFTVPASTTATYALVTRDWGNSANEALSVAFNVNGEPQPPAPLPVASLNPFTSNPQCGIGGSCSLITDARKQCILAAIGQPGCSGGCTG